MLFEALGSLTTYGFKRFVIVNGYRIANIPWIQIFVERTQPELSVRVAVYDPECMCK